MDIDEKYMLRALQIARRGLFYVSPNPMVGAVIVNQDGKIIGEGYHRQVGGAHAEVNAINSVKDPEALKNSTLYVTLEPCCHQGRTAPCTDLIIQKGIPRVVVGTRDNYAKVNGKGIETLRNAGVEVVEDVCKDLCDQLNAMFFTAHKHKRPYVILKWAQSMDGFLDVTRSDDQPAAEISNPLTHSLAHRVRAVVDGILVGSGTILADNPQLDNRLWCGRSPRPVILDRRGRVDQSYKVMDGDPIIYREDKSLEEILHDLYEKGMITLLVEGGSEVLNAFIKEGLWDFARVETAPVAFGEYGSVKAPNSLNSEARLTFNIEGHTLKYYINNPMVVKTEMI